MLRPLGGVGRRRRCLSASVPRSAASATRGTRIRSVSVAAEERDGLALELELPVLVGLEHRPRAGAERAVVEEDDVLAKEELPGEVFRQSAPLQGRIEGIAQAVAEERRREHGDGEGGGREHRHVPVKEHEIHADIDHLAPARGRRRNADAEEAEARLEHHRERDGEHEPDDDRRDRVGDQVAADDVPGRGAERLRRAHELLLA